VAENGKNAKCAATNEKVGDLPLKRDKKTNKKKKQKTGAGVGVVTVFLGVQERQGKKQPAAGAQPLLFKERGKCLLRKGS